MHAFRIALSIILLSAMASTSRATTKEIQLQCFTQSADAGTTSTSVADLIEIGEYQASGAGSSLDARTFNFSPSTDQEIFCTTIVPSDYYESSTTEPFVTFYGWLTDCIKCLSGCGGMGCSTTTQYIEFEVSSRRVFDGDTIGSAWGTADTTTSSQTCQTSTACFATDGWLEGKVHAFQADATDDADNWEVGDLIYIRILRDVSTGDNLPESFAVAAVQLSYPID